MFEIRGQQYATREQAIKNARHIANASQQPVYVWEVETDLPCGLVQPEIAFPVPNNPERTV